MRIIVRNDLRFDACPACGSALISELYKPLNYNLPVSFSTSEIDLEKKPEIWLCSNCQSKFTQNVIPEAKAIELYTNGNSGDRWTPNTFKDEKTEDLIEYLTPYLLPNLKLLDIGCGTGNLLDYGKENGCLTFGVEYSSVALSIASEKGHILYSSLESVEGKFDVITAFDLIEHLYDVPSFLLKIRYLLNDDGCLILFTGNPDCKTAQVVKKNWWYFNFPEHIVFLSQKFFNEKLTDFYQHKYQPCYNSKSYVPRKFYSWIKMTVYLLVKYKKYVGIPSCQPDHALIILKIRQ